jgi:hypothetical protein
MDVPSQFEKVSLALVGTEVSRYSERAMKKYRIK